MTSDFPFDPAQHPCLRLGALFEPVDGAWVGAPRHVTVDPDLLGVAGRHHVVPALFSALSRQGLRADEPELDAYLGAVYGLNARRNARLASEIREIGGALSAVGVRPVFLKGAALLLLGLHDDPAARFLGDVDVLIAPDEIAAAAAALAAIGYRRAPDGPVFAHDRVKLAHPQRPGQVELHHPAVPWHLAAALPPEEMSARAVAVPGLPEAAVPCRTDLVLHNVLHAMLHDWSFAMADLPMRDALDLALLARAGGVEWTEVTERIARAPQGGQALAFCLAAAGEAFAWAPLPDMATAGGAARTLRAWRDRRGQPTGRIRRRLANVAEHSGRARRALDRALGRSPVVAGS